MKRGSYLFLIPTSASLDFEENTSDSEQPSKVQERINKIGGLVFILFSI